MGACIFKGTVRRPRKDNPVRVAFGFLTAAPRVASVRFRRPVSGAWIDLIPCRPSTREQGCVIRITAGMITVFVDSSVMKVAVRDLLPVERSRELNLGVVMPTLGLGARR